VSEPATNATNKANDGSGLSVLTPIARKSNAPTIPESNIPHAANKTF